MKVVKLVEVVKELESGSRPKGGVSSETGIIPSLGAEHLSEDGGFNFHKNKFITADFFNNLKAGKVKCNDILIVKDGATTGKVSFVQNDFPFTDAAINEHVFRIAIDQQIGFSKYVYFFLRSSEGKKQILNDFRGATVGGISRQFIESTKIPLPLLDDQIRIANVLSRVEALITKHKESIRLLDELVKSAFLEMFGDPVRNEKGWEKKELKFFGQIITGNTPPRSDEDNYSSNFIEWIKTDNIVADRTFLTAATEYLSEKGLAKARFVTTGALLVACIAGSVESIGRTAIANRQVSFNQQINAIQPNEKTNSLFLYWLFKVSKLYVQSKATKGMKKILTKGDFEKIAMITPSFTLQNQFAAIVEKVESLKAKYTQSLTELENLYGSLSQRAFRGELELNKVDLEVEPIDIRRSL